MGRVNPVPLIEDLNLLPILVILRHGKQKSLPTKEMLDFTRRWSKSSSHKHPPNIGNVVVSKRDLEESHCSNHS